MTTLYRYYDTECGDKVFIELERFHVIGETPCGYWYIPGWLKAFPESAQQESKRWVSKEARVRRCYPTKDEAWRSYCLRKYHQQGHLLRAQARLDAVLKLIDNQSAYTAPEGPRLPHGNLVSDVILSIDL